MARHRITGAVIAVLLLVVGACGSATSGEDPGAVPTSAPATSSPSTTAPVTESPLGGRTEPLGSALYDPQDHRERERSPARLDIPSIGVRSAPVDAVGVEPNGEMEIPAAERVGWYRFGAGPGEQGSTVLAAHIAYGGVDGVFRSLDRVAPGEEVVVGSDDGSSRAYRVTEVVTYAKDALPADVFSADGDERLVLITCGGTFNPQLRSYESNVVAYAVPA